jgi:hypothetical protein
MQGCRLPPPSSFRQQGSETPPTTSKAPAEEHEAADYDGEDEEHDTGCNISDVMDTKIGHVIIMHSKKHLCLANIFMHSLK